MKKIILLILGLALIGGLGTAAYLKGASEDSWICVNNQLVKHGNPSAAMPTNGCGKVEIPVQLKAGDKFVALDAYFSNSRMAGESVDCSLVFPVKRIVEKTVAVGSAALVELLRGPNEAEKAVGYNTSINVGTAVVSLVIQDGLAKVVFNSVLEQGMGGSCRVSAIRAQIEKTLKQFPTVQKVEIGVAGKDNDEVLQP